MISRSQAPTQGELISEEAAEIGPTRLDVEKTLKSLHGKKNNVIIPLKTSTQGILNTSYRHMSLQCNTESLC